MHDGQLLSMEMCNCIRCNQQKKVKFPFPLFLFHARMGATRDSFSCFLHTVNESLRDFQPFLTLVQSIKQHVCRRESSGNVQLHIETTWFLLLLLGASPHVINSRSNYKKFLSNAKKSSNLRVSFSLSAFPFCINL